MCPVPVEWRLAESLRAVSGSWDTSGGSPMSMALPREPGSRKPTARNRLFGSSGGLDPSAEAEVGGEVVVVVVAAGDASDTTSTWKRLREGFCSDISYKNTKPVQKKGGKGGRKQAVANCPNGHREINTCAKSSRKLCRANIHRNTEAGEVLKLIRELKGLAAEGDDKLSL